MSLALPSLLADSKNILIMNVAYRGQRDLRKCNIVNPQVAMPLMITASWFPFVLGLESRDCSASDR
jgi:hypothetical protein